MKRRHIQPEILDGLSPDDPRAIQSRRDLQKINAFMGHTGVVLRALRAAPAPPRLVVDIGTGDGTLLLKVARRLDSHAGMRALLVDRRPIVSAATLKGFKDAGWDVEIHESDVFEWLCRPRAETADATVANLFLHHFREGELAHLLNLTAQHTKRFISLEPQRSRTALAGASLLPLIGCNDVTVHDADVSVRAGFRDRELSALWPPEAAWHLTERRAGLFSHAFIATRDTAVTTAVPPSRVSRISA
ncbi:MAG: methyltransferase domain-containing protein [Vicinamibacterales bacterium]